MPLCWSRLASQLSAVSLASRPPPLPLEGGVGPWARSCSPRDRRRPPGVAPLSAINRAVWPRVVGWFRWHNRPCHRSFQAAQSALFGVAGRAAKIPRSPSFLLTTRPQALAAAFDRDRQRFCCPARQDPAPAGGHRGGANRADAHSGVLEAVAIEPAQRSAELGVLGDGRLPAAQALGGD